MDCSLYKDKSEHCLVPGLRLSLRYSSSMSMVSLQPLSPKCSFLMLSCLLYLYGRLLPCVHLPNKVRCKHPASVLRHVVIMLHKMRVSWPKNSCCLGHLNICSYIGLFSWHRRSRCHHMCSLSWYRCRRCHVMFSVLVQM